MTVASTTALAQVTGTVDVGAGSVNYEGVSSLSAYSISPRLDLTKGLARGVVSATFSRFNDEGWGWRGLSAASVLSPAFRRFRGEVTISAESNSNRVITAGGRYGGELRLHYAGREAGLWAGLGRSRVWNGSFWQDSDQSEIGAWLVVGPASLQASVSSFEYERLSRLRPNRTYQTAEAILSIRERSLDLDASVGRRYGADLEPTTIWSVGGAYWLTRFVAISGAGGKYAFDPAQVLPGGTYVTLGMRIAPANIFHRPARHRRPPPAAERSGFSVKNEGSGTRVFRYVEPTSESVELVGSFTDWRPVAMVEVLPGVWELRMTLRPGPYFFNIRTDGGEWVVPEGVTRVEDDFNGTVGLIIVPR